MNHQMMLAVADAIEAEADHFKMSSFFNVKGAESTDWEVHKEAMTKIRAIEQADVPIPTLTEVKTQCGTTGCIAGWATILSRGGRPLRKDWEWEGTLALGLTSNEAYSLFYGGVLPDGMATSAYNTARTLRYLVRNGFSGRKNQLGGFASITYSMLDDDEALATTQTLDDFKPGDRIVTATALHPEAQFEPDFMVLNHKLGVVSTPTHSESRYVHVWIDDYEYDTLFWPTEIRHVNVKS